MPFKKTTILRKKIVFIGNQMCYNDLDNNDQGAGKIE